MATIKSLSKKIQQLNTDAVIDTAFKQSTDELAVENKKQLFEGFDNTGEKIKRKYRSNKYARVKNQMNPLPGLGVPDLKVTGSFYNGIKVDYQSGVLTTEPSDSKGADLEEKYSGIFGLGGKFKNEFINKTLRPAINTQITAATGLKFGK